MTPAEVITAIQFARTLEQLIVKEVELLRAKGENTPEVEAAYTDHQKRVYQQPYAQPELPSQSPAPS